MLNVYTNRHVYFASSKMLLLFRCEMRISGRMSFANYPATINLMGNRIISGRISFTIISIINLFLDKISTAVIK